MDRFHARLERSLAASGLIPSGDASRRPADSQPLEWLVERGLPEERVLEAAAAALGLGYSTLADERLDEALLKDLGGAAELEARGVAPLASAAGPRLAMADPLDLPFLDRCEAILGRRPEPVLALPRAIRAMYERRRPPLLREGLSVCPECGGALATIVYGRPEPGGPPGEDTGCVYAGDLVPPDAPALHCRRCGRDYRTESAAGQGAAGPKACECPGCPGCALSDRPLCAYCDDAPGHVHCPDCGRAVAGSALVRDGLRSGLCVECSKKGGSHAS